MTRWDTILLEERARKEKTGFSAIVGNRRGSREMVTSGWDGSGAGIVGTYPAFFRRPSFGYIVRQKESKRKQLVRLDQPAKTQVFLDDDIWGVC